jgi:5'-nucleotidase
MDSDESTSRCCDILEILPFEDPLVVIELDGGAIWDALESSLATWPTQEVVSYIDYGMGHCFNPFPRYFRLRASWDSCRKPGEHGA